MYYQDDWGKCLQCKALVQISQIEHGKCLRCRSVSTASREPASSPGPPPRTESPDTLWIEKQAERANQIMADWPEWKRNVLGYVASLNTPFVTGCRSGYAATIMDLSSIPTNSLYEVSTSGGQPESPTVEWY